jgi:hypothetical protein
LTQIFWVNPVKFMLRWFSQKRKKIEEDECDEDDEARDVDALVRQHVAKILLAGDLHILSRKMVRQQLAERGFGGADTHKVNAIINDVLQSGCLERTGRGGGAARSSSRGQKRAALEPKVVEVPPLVGKLTMVLEALMATQAKWKFCAPVVPIAMGRRVIETRLIIFN